MKIYVVRHGETSVNLEEKINGINDDDLNKTGIEQAKKLRKFISKIDYDFIISSPLTRAKNTAKLLNTKNKQIIFDERIIERNAGIFTKTFIKDIDSDDWWNVYPKEDYKDAETVESVLKRINCFIDDIKEEYKNNNIIIVTHGGVSKAISCYLYGIPKDGNLQKYKHKNCEIKEYNL